MPENQKLDWERPLQTRSGYKAKLLCSLNGRQHYTRGVVILGHPDGDLLTDYTEEGVYCVTSNNNLDLINQPRTLVRYIAWLEKRDHWERDETLTFGSKADAEAHQAAYHNIIASAHVVLVEGQHATE